MCLSKVVHSGSPSLGLVRLAVEHGCLHAGQIMATRPLSLTQVTVIAHSLPLVRVLPILRLLSFAPLLHLEIVKSALFSLALSIRFESFQSLWRIHPSFVFLLLLSLYFSKEIFLHLCSMGISYSDHLSFLFGIVTWFGIFTWDLGYWNLLRDGSTKGIYRAFRIFKVGKIINVVAICDTLLYELLILHLHSSLSWSFILWDKGSDWRCHELLNRVTANMTLLFLLDNRVLIIHLLYSSILLDSCCLWLLVDNFCFNRRFYLLCHMGLILLGQLWRLWRICFLLASNLIDGSLCFLSTRAYTEMTCFSFSNRLGWGIW